MNNARRNKLAKITSSLADLMTQLEAIEDAEQDAFDNLPESIAATERGDQMGEFIDELSLARDQIEEARDQIKEVFSADSAIA